MTPSPLLCAQCRVWVHHLVSFHLFRPRPAACQQSKEQKENKSTKCKQDARQDGKGYISTATTIAWPCNQVPSIAVLVLHPSLLF